MDGTSASLVGELTERIRGPEGVLIHPNGRVYVAGAWSGNVVVYRDGAVVNELTGLSSPHDLELAPDGDDDAVAENLVSPREADSNFVFVLLDFFHKGARMNDNTALFKFFAQGRR